MARTLFWTIWAMVPLAAIALHLGPGQRLLAHDTAADHVRLAALAEQKEDWVGAADHYAAARENLPDAGASERTRLLLREARARVYAGEIVQGSEQLESIVAEQEAKGTPDADALREARDGLGEASYFTAWLMRLEGAAADEWKPESEKARQQYRLLAESAPSGPDAESFKKNVESVIRLELMDLSELQSLPLPKKCNCNCKGLCQKKREQRLSKCKGGKNDDDAREKIKTNSAGAAKERQKGS